MVSKIWISSFILSVSSAAFAVVDTAPDFLPFQAQITLADDSPVVGPITVSGADFILQIVDASCVLYQEVYSGTDIPNGDSKGIFALSIGSPPAGVNQTFAKNSGGATDLTFRQLLKNGVVRCIGDVGDTTLPAKDRRTIRFSLDGGTTFSTSTDKVDIGSVAYAFYADQAMIADTSTTTLGIGSFPISGTAAAPGQVLALSGGVWTPTALTSGSVTSVAGLGGGHVTVTTGTTTAVLSLNNTGATTGEVLIAGAGGTPSFGAISLASGSPAITGTLTPANGGTGIASPFVAGGVLISSSTTAFAITAVGAAGQPLLSGGGTAPAFGKINLADDVNVVNGVLNVGNGGTGQTTLAAHGVLIGNAVTGVNVTTAGNQYQVLRVATPGADPSFGSIDLSKNGGTEAVTGILNVSNGGTGAALTANAGAIIYGGGSQLNATLTDGTAILWDDTNKRLGIKVGAPSTALDISGAISVEATISPGAGIATQGRIWFDSTTHTFKVFDGNGGPTELIQPASNPYVGTTAGTFTGGTGGSGVAGLAGAAAKCSNPAQVPGGATHMCSDHEVYLARQVGGALPDVDAWVNVASVISISSPTVKYSNCGTSSGPWTSNGNGVNDSAPFWDTTGNVVVLASNFATLCGVPRKIACCR